MTENMKIAITAINKFIFFSWNYDVVQHHWKTIHGDNRKEYVPRFLAEVKWNCNFDHIYGKWRLATASENPHEYMMKFYAEMGNENRVLMLEWIVENYNGERKII